MQWDGMDEKFKMVVRETAFAELRREFSHVFRFKYLSIYDPATEFHIKYSVYYSV
jgi:hypothetical protein